MYCFYTINIIINMYEFCIINMYCFYIINMYCFFNYFAYFLILEKINYGEVSKNCKKVEISCWSKN